MLKHLINFKLKSILIFVSALILAACGGGGDGEAMSDDGVYQGGTANRPVVTGGAPVVLGGYTQSSIYCCYYVSDNNFFSPEGVTSVFTVEASDAEGDSIAFSVSGDDGSKIAFRANDGSDRCS